MGINNYQKRTRMGIDLVKRGRFKNLYQHLLIKLFTFLSRRTDSKFCATVLRRLIASRTNRPPVSLSRLIKHLGNDKSRTVVAVACVTDDERVLDMPSGLKIAALRFTEAARARITANGGTCMTLDQLIMQTPSGTNTLLLRGPKEREARRHFGAHGVPHSHAKPYTRGRKTE